MKKEDRRVKKTEKALAEALSKLLVDKKIQNITIRELTETADLHRSTFYTHYTDIYDLYEKLENSFFQDLDEIISYDTTHSYEDLYVINHGDIQFQKRLNNLIEENYLKIWLQEDKKTVITEEMRYFTIYHIQGCLSVLNHWVESNFAYSKKKMLTFLRLLNDNIEPIMP